MVEGELHEDLLRGKAVFETDPVLGMLVPKAQNAVNCISRVKTYSMPSPFNQQNVSYVSSSRLVSKL